MTHNTTRGPEDDRRWWQRRKPNRGGIDLAIDSNGERYTTRTFGADGDPWQGATILTSGVVAQLREDGLLPLTEVLPALSCSALWSRNQGVSCCVDTPHTVHRGSDEPDAPTWDDTGCAPGTLHDDRGGR